MEDRDGFPLYTSQPLDWRNKLRRTIWLITWTLLYRITPVSMHGWRCVVLRAFGAKIEKGASPYPTARIWAPWNLTMEQASCLGPGVECYCVAPIILRSRATVSQRTFLCAASHDAHDHSFPLLLGKIEIASNAWIAAEAFIGPGVFIGNSAVVAARAVVVKNVKANKIVVGNPAREVGTRY